MHYAYFETVEVERPDDEDEEKCDYWEELYQMKLDPTNSFRTMPNLDWTFFTGSVIGKEKQRQKES